MRKIKKLKISKVYDLQNSSRTNFYKKILFPSSDVNVWSSSETTLPKDKTKEEFDKKSVLERFSHQLQTSGLNVKHTMLPDFSWSCTDISKIEILSKSSPIDTSTRILFIKIYSVLSC